MTPEPRKLEEHETCFCGSGLPRYGIYFASSIYAGQVCEKCEPKVIASKPPGTYYDYSKP